MTLTDFLPFVTGPAGAIVALTCVFWLVIKGKLVTGREHARALREYDKVARANDTLTASLEACRDTNAQLRAANAQLLNTGELTTRVLDAFSALAQQRSGRPGEGGG